MQPNPRLKNVYEFLSTQNVKNFPKSYGEFESKMGTDQSLSGNVYNYLKSHKVKNLPDTYEGFYESVGLKKKEPAGQDLSSPVPTGGESSLPSQGTTVSLTPEQQEAFRNLRKPKESNLFSEKQEQLLKERTVGRSIEGFVPNLVEDVSQILPSFNREDVSQIPPSFNRGVISAATAIPKTVGIIGKQLDELIGDDRPLESYPTYQAGKWLEDKALEVGITATDPDREGFMNSTIPQAFGQVIGMLLTGGSSSSSVAKGGSVKELTKTLTSAPAITGALQVAVPEYEAAKAAGMDDDEAFGVFMKNIPGGLTEVVPIMNGLSRINKITGGGIVNTFKNLSVNGLEEAVQETVQQYYSNVIADESYDPGRDPMNGVLEGAGAGFFVGFVLPGLIGAMQNAKPSQKAKIREYLNQKLKDIKEQPIQTDEVQGDVGKAFQETVEKTVEKPVMSDITNKTEDIAQDTEQIKSDSKITSEEDIAVENSPEQTESIGESQDNVENNLETEASQFANQETINNLKEEFNASESVDDKIKIYAELIKRGDDFIEESDFYDKHRDEIFREIDPNSRTTKDDTLSRSEEVEFDWLGTTKKGKIISEEDGKYKIKGTDGTIFRVKKSDVNSDTNLVTKGNGASIGVGFEFIDPQDRKLKVVGKKGDDLFVIDTSLEKPFKEIMTKDEIEEIIHLEEKGRGERQSIKEANKKREKEEQEQAVIKANVDGFTDGMPPLQKGKAEKDLNRVVKIKDKRISLKNYIKEKIGNGYSVKKLPNGDRALMDKNGVFIGNKNIINKTALDYAEFIIKKSKSKDANKGVSNGRADVVQYNSVVNSLSLEDATKIANKYYDLDKTENPYEALRDGYWRAKTTKAPSSSDLNIIKDIENGSVPDQTQQQPSKPKTKKRVITQAQQEEPSDSGVSKEAGERQSVESLSQDLDAIVGKQKDATKKDPKIIAANLNPLLIAKAAWTGLNKAQNLTFGKFAKKTEDWVSKKVKKGVSSKNYALRNASNSLQSLLGGLAYEHGDLKNKLNYMGNKNYAHLKAKMLAEDMYKIIDSDPASLSRLQAVLDPETSVGTEQEGLSYDDLNDTEKSLHDIIRKTNDFVHDWHFKEGLIDEETYNKNKGSYIARLYEDFELIDPEVEAAFKSSRADFNMFKQRKDFEDVHAKIMRDPVYATAKRVSQMLQNQAIFDYAKAISNSDIKVSDEEFPGSTLLPAGSRSYFVTENGKKVKKTDKINYYGDLSGKYVPSHIAQDFKGFAFGNKMLQSVYSTFRGYDKLMLRQFLKRSKTVYNPVVQLGNMLSNFSFASWVGVDPLTFATNAVKARKEINNNSERYQDLVKAGMIGTDLFTSDVTPLKVKDDPKTVFDKIRNKINKAGERASEIYGKTDDISKLSAYISLLEDGYSKENALELVYEGFQNYATVGKLYDFASKTPIVGNPYIKFKADLMRIIKNSMTRRPLTTSLYLAALVGLKDMLSDASDEDDDIQAIRERRSFIPKIKTPFGNVPLVFQTPAGEINVARFISPYYIYDKGDKNDMLNDITEWLPYQLESVRGESVPQFEMADVLLGTYAQLYFDRDFRGMSILDPDATPFTGGIATTEEKIANALNYIARSQVPMFRSSQDMISAYNGEADYYGRERDMTQALLNNIIKIQEFGEEQARETLTKEIKYKMGKFESLSRDVSQLKSVSKNKISKILGSETMSQETKSRLIQEEVEALNKRILVKVQEQAEITKELNEPEKLLKSLN